MTTNKYLNRILFCIQATSIVLLGTWGNVAQAKAKVQVISVLTDHAWVARKIGGARVQVRALLTGREDPHHIAARPSLVLLASNADLYISPGMSLDVGYTPLILRNSRNAKIQVGAKGHVDASRYVRKRQVLKRISRGMGDVHAQGNPHYHLDPVAMIASAQAIAEGLSRVDPVGKPLYTKAYLALRKELLGRLVGKILVQTAGAKRLLGLLHKGALLPFLQKTKVGGRSLVRYLGGWMKEMHKLRGQKLVSHHRQWTYFLRRFGLRSVGQLEPKPGIPPTAKHLRTLIALCKQEQPRWIIAARYYGAGSARFLAKKTGATLLHVPFHTKGSAKANNYTQLIDELVSHFLRSK